jgi:hypothetical protein
MTTSYSEVVGDRFNQAPVDRRAVDIVSVGGTSGWANGSPVQVNPGLQRVVISSQNHRGFRGRTVAFELNVEPCTRYYINAQFANPVTPDFVPVIDHQETIAGCVWPRPSRS